MRRRASPSPAGCVPMSPCSTSTCPVTGSGATAEIATHQPDTSVVMLTVSRVDDDLFAALKAGASGYLLKDTDPDRLPLALRGVLDGEAALPRTLVTRVVEEFRSREDGGGRWAGFRCWDNGPLRLDRPRE